MHVKEGKKGLTGEVLIFVEHGGIKKKGSCWSVMKDGREKVLRK